MWMNRVITLGSSKGNMNVVIQSREENNKMQLWTYDAVSKTIKSVENTQKSADARSTNVAGQNTDSRWY
jgi:hypothetical protein